MQAAPASPAAEAPHPGLPLPQRWHATVAIVLGIAMTVIEGMIVNLALPALARDLDASASATVWVVNAYQLAVLALLLPLASLGERVGYRRVYLAGVVVFTLASAACAASGSLAMLVAARALQGMGAAGLMAVNAALVRLTYPAESLGRGIALNSVVVALSSVAGPALSAAILSVADWPWLFAINLPLGVLLVWLGARALPSNPPPSGPPRQASVLDALLNAGMFCGVFLAIDLLGARAGEGAGGVEAVAAARWGPLPAGGWLLAAALVVGVVHVRRQVRQAVPLLPIDLLRIRVFRLSMATSVCAFAAQTLAFIALPFLLLDAWHLGSGQAGALMACWPAGVVVAAPVAGRLIGRLPGGLLGGVGLGALALGLAALALLAGSAARPGLAWAVGGALLLCGLGFGCFQSPNNHVILTSAPARRAGAAGGMLATARLTGQSTGAVCIAAVFAVAAAGAGGPQAALALAAASSAAAAVFSALRLRED
jgi:DHA2 family multidrug resistance protein-like MFS transporter